MNIAILSPSQNAYSETFIQAHKNHLDGNIFYYYGDSKNIRLEGEGSINKNSKALFYKLKRKLFKKKYSWYFNQLLIDSLKRNKIDVVLAEYGTTAEMCLKPIKELNIPLIIHFHGYDASKKQIIKANNNYKKSFDYASYVIAVSKKMYQDLLSIGCPESKLILNTYGPNPEFYKVYPLFNNQQFIAVGRFVNKKAPYYLLLSFAEVIKEFPNAQLIIAGKGELWDTCKNLSVALGLEKNVSLPGIISPEQFQAYLSESLAFVQHSVIAEDGDSEGTPVAILEACAAGLPVISTYHAGIPDVVIDGYNGFLVKEHDYKTMAVKINHILSEKDLARGIGENSRKRIQDNFSLEKHINRLDELIKSLVP
ncbi:glycosyltransferase family 4 protein [Zunongwangia sp.]|uniref:glycosyltransferase family 4 protein n=1 Tax=Zunongwangia sp. TaxID=1965325 RepID=UPI003AA88783